MSLKASAWFNQDKNQTNISVREGDGDINLFFEAKVDSDVVGLTEQELVSTALSWFASRYISEYAVQKAEKQSEQAKAVAEGVQNDVDKLAKLTKLTVLHMITSGNNLDPTLYAAAVDEIDLAVQGTTYHQNDIFSLENTGYTPKYGEGTKVLVQVNKDYTYNGETVKELNEGNFTLNGVGAVWFYTQGSADSGVIGN